jgi:hypothetical protein
MRYFSFKILIFCILLPPILYNISIQTLERFLNEKYAVELENAYLGDTRLLLDGSIRLKDSINDNINRYLQSKFLTRLGLKMEVTVSTKKGTLLYPGVFENDREILFPRDSTLVAAENYDLMNEGLIVKLEAKVEHNKLLSNAILAVYIILSLLVLFLYYRKATNKLLQAEMDRSREMNRLLELEEQTNRKLKNLDQDRNKLTADLNRLKAALDDEKNKATRNEVELFDEIVALEEKLNQNLALQREQQAEISNLKEQLQQHESEKQKVDKKRIKAGQSAGKRFSALYKNISVNGRALEGFAELNEDLKIKAEEVIHQLNQDPSLVIIKRKVFIGKRDRKTIMEVIFGYKGRLYFRNLKDSGIEVLAIGTKNTQAREMEFLNKL